MVWHSGSLMMGPCWSLRGRTWWRWTSATTPSGKSTIAWSVRFVKKRNICRIVNLVLVMSTISNIYNLNRPWSDVPHYTFATWFTLNTAWFTQRFSHASHTLCLKRFSHGLDMVFHSCFLCHIRFFNAYVMNVVFFF